MKRQTIKAGLSVLAGLVLAAGLRAQTNNGLAGVAAPWLKFPSDPRSAAMGNAFVAVADDVNAAQINPAGLSQLTGQQASFMHNAWFQGIADEQVTYGLPLKALGQAGLAAGVDFINFGSIERYTVNANNTLTDAGSFNPSAYHVDLAYGQAWGSLAAGANLKVLGQSLDSDNSSSFGLDLGSLWKPDLAGMSFGLAVQNLGAQLDGSNLPTNLKLGGAWAGRAGAGNKLTLAADLDLPTADASSTSVGLGGEFWYQGLLAGRLGYVFANTGTLTGITGLTAGVGLKYRWAEVDYALVTEGDLGTGNLISLLVGF